MASMRILPANRSRGSSRKRCVGTARTMTSAWRTTSAVVGDASDGIEEVEPAQAERLHRGGDSVRDCLGRSDVHRAVIDLVYELLVCRWPPAALTCCPLELLLVVGPLDLEGLVVGVG